MQLYHFATIAEILQQLQKTYALLTLMLFLKEIAFSKENVFCSVEFDYSHDQS